MSNESVDRALAALRDAHALEPPDRALEARLLARHRWRRRHPRLLPLFLGVALLGGVAFAGAGGVEWLRTTWFAVEVDGERIEGRLEGDGSRRLEFETATGGRARVDVATETLPDGGARTRVGIEQHEGGDVEVEESDVVVGAEPAWIEVASRTADCAGEDNEGRPFELYLVDGEPARLALLRPHVDPARAVVAGRLPDLPRHAAPLIECDVLPGGDVAVRLTSAGPVEFDFEVLVRLADRPLGSAPPTHLSTPDGRVRVRVEPDRP